jgi:hypothetical protein
MMVSGIAESNRATHPKDGCCRATRLAVAGMDQSRLEDDGNLPECALGVEILGEQIAS